MTLGFQCTFTGSIENRCTCAWDDEAKMKVFAVTQCESAPFTLLPDLPRTAPTRSYLKNAPRRLLDFESCARQSRHTNQIPTVVTAIISTRNDAFSECAHQGRLARNHVSQSRGTTPSSTINLAAALPALRPPTAGDCRERAARLQSERRDRQDAIGCRMPRIHR